MVLQPQPKVIHVHIHAWLMLGRLEERSGIFRLMTFRKKIPTGLVNDSHMYKNAPSGEWLKYLCHIREF